MHPIFKAVPHPHLRLKVVVAWLSGALLLTSQALLAQQGATLDTKPTATADQIAQWVDELGDNDYLVRQAAAEQLLGVGIAARVALRKLADGPNPETRAAARRLVTLIEQSDFAWRLKEFIADTDGKQGITLPGWETYRQVMGEDAAARGLFVTMQQDEASLLATLFAGGANSKNARWEDRIHRLRNWRITNTYRIAQAQNRTSAPPLGSCATMLFLGTVLEQKISDQGAMSLAQLAMQPPIRQEIESGKHHEAIERLVTHWVLHCPSQNKTVLLQKLGLMQTYGLRRALPLAIKIIQRVELYQNLDAQTRAIAILTIGKLGGPEHVALIEPLLKDRTTCMSVRVANVKSPLPVVQVGDVALAVVLHLTDQKLADYGLVHASFNHQKIFNMGTLRFASNTERDQALVKWQLWSDSQAQ